MAVGFAAAAFRAFGGLPASTFLVETLDFETLDFETLDFETLVFEMLDAFFTAFVFVDGLLALTVLAGFFLAATFVRAFVVAFLAAGLLTAFFLAGCFLAGFADALRALDALVEGRFAGFLVVIFFGLKELAQST